MTNEEIGETIGFYIFVGLMGQALIISWMFNKLIDVLE